MIRFMALGVVLCLAGPLAAEDGDDPASGGVDFGANEVPATDEELETFLATPPPPTLVSDQTRELERIPEVQPTNLVISGNGVPPPIVANPSSISISDVSAIVTDNPFQN